MQTGKKHFFLLLVSVYLFCKKELFNKDIPLWNANIKYKDNFLLADAWYLIELFVANLDYYHLQLNHRKFEIILPLLYLVERESQSDENKFWIFELGQI